MAKKRSSKKSPTLDKMLAQSGKEELIEIIKTVVKRDPSMKEVVDLAMAAPKPGKPVNVSAYRQQARLAKSGDWLNAGAIYHVALDEAVAGYDDLVRSMDRDGDISAVMDDLAEGLGKALEKSRADAKTRWNWIETMLDAPLRSHRFSRRCRPAVTLAATAKRCYYSPRYSTVFQLRRRDT